MKLEFTESSLSKVEGWTFPGRFEISHFWFDDLINLRGKVEGLGPSLFLINNSHCSLTTRHVELQLFPLNIIPLMIMFPTEVFAAAVYLHSNGISKVGKQSHTTCAC